MSFDWYETKAFNILTAKAHINAIGYKPFKPNTIFRQSKMTYIDPSFDGDPDSPSIFVLEGENKDILNLWSNTYTKILVSTGDDRLDFNNNLFINNENFLIYWDSNKMSDAIEFSESNTFLRESIYGVDEMTTLGYKKFIVTNSGILFSVHELPEHKTTFSDGNNGYVLFADKEIVYKKELLPFGIEQEYNISSIHLFPKWSFK